MGAGAGWRCTTSALPEFSQALIGNWWAVPGALSIATLLGLQGGTERGDLSIPAAVGVFVVGFGLLAFRARRLQLLCGDDGRLKVRNLFRSYTLDPGTVAAASSSRLTFIQRRGRLLNASHGSIEWRCAALRMRGRPRTARELRVLATAGYATNSEQLRCFHRWCEEHGVEVIADED